MAYIVRIRFGDQIEYFSLSVPSKMKVVVRHRCTMRGNKLWMDKWKMSRQDNVFCFPLSFCSFFGFCGAIVCARIVGTESNDNNSINYSFSRSLVYNLPSFLTFFFFVNETRDEELWNATKLTHTQTHTWLTRWRRWTTTMCGLSGVNGFLWIFLFSRQAGRRRRLCFLE